MWSETDKQTSSDSEWPLGASGGGKTQPQGAGDAALEREAAA